MTGHVSDCCGTAVMRSRRRWFGIRRWWCAACAEPCRRVLPEGQRS